MNLGAMVWYQKLFRRKGVNARYRKAIKRDLHRRRRADRRAKWHKSRPSRRRRAIRRYVPRPVSNRLVPNRMRVKLPFFYTEYLNRVTTATTGGSAANMLLSPIPSENVRLFSALSMARAANPTGASTDIVKPKGWDILENFYDDYVCHGGKVTVCLEKLPYDPNESRLSGEKPMPYQEARSARYFFITTNGIHNYTPTLSTDANMTGQEFMQHSMIRRKRLMPGSAELNISGAVSVAYVEACKSTTCTPGSTRWKKTFYVKNIKAWDRKNIYTADPGEFTAPMDDTTAPANDTCLQAGMCVPFVVDSTGHAGFPHMKVSYYITYDVTLFNPTSQA